MYKMEVEKQIDIVNLVENNQISKISGENSSEMVKKISNKFSTYEQHLFLANFYCYLNYNTRKDFVVNLDNIWKWIGFSQKVRAKELLVNNFKENEDYRVEKLAFSEEKASLEHGGNNKEDILLTVHCFKKLCLKAKTKKSDEIHDYYITLEETMNEIVSEQSEKLRNQLQIAQKENLTVKEKTMIDAYHKKPTLYIAYVEEKLAKFGYSNDIKTRLTAHKREMGDQVSLYYVIETVYNRELECLIKSNLKDKIISKDFPNRKETCTELIQLGDKYTIEDFYNEVINFKKTIDSGEMMIKLVSENEDLKRKVSTYEKMNLEKIDNDHKVSKLINENEELLKTIKRNPDTKVYNGNILFIRHNKTTTLYKIGIYDGIEKDQEEYKEIYTYKSKNSREILNIFQIFIKMCNVQDDKYSIEYDKLKKILDFCIILYDNYMINESVDNAIFFIVKSASRNTFNKSVINESIDKDIFLKFFDDKIIKDKSCKIPLAYLQEEFVKWYEITYGDPSFITAGKNNWSSKYRQELVDNLQEHLSLKMEDIDIHNYDKSINYHNYAGFVGITTKNFELKLKESFKYYKDEDYQKYIDEYITITNDSSNKVGRKELLDDFTLYAKRNNFYNKYTFGKIFSMKFASEIIEFIENKTGIKYNPHRSKTRLCKGVFEGLVHKNFDCICYK